MEGKGGFVDGVVEEGGNLVGRVKERGVVRWVLLVFHSTLEEKIS